MRLWSLAPTYLDAKGLVAVWREALLARAVLRGDTRGYRHHPQLDRFRAHPAPLSAINRYLRGLYEEAQRRGYRFDKTKIGPIRNLEPIPVTRGQLAFELAHLSAKVEARSPGDLGRLPSGDRVRAHPLFTLSKGPPEVWERR